MSYGGNSLHYVWVVKFHSVEYRCHFCQWLMPILGYQKAHLPLGQPSEGWSKARRKDLSVVCHGGTTFTPLTKRLGLACALYNPLLLLPALRSIWLPGRATSIIASDTIQLSEQSLTTCLPLAFLKLQSCFLSPLLSLGSHLF